MSEKFMHGSVKELSLIVTPSASPEIYNKVEPASEHEKPMCDFTYSAGLDRILNQTFRGRRQLFDMDV